MRDPVVAEDGFSYERMHINQWMVKNLTSPMTRKAFKSKALYPNYQLKSVIQDYLTKNPGIVPKPPIPFKDFRPEYLKKAD